MANGIKKIMKQQDWQLLRKYAGYFKSHKKWFFLSLASIPVTTAAGILFLWLVEFRGKAEQFANNWFVKHCRLWGMVSLSVYCLAIFELWPRWFLGSAINLLFSSELNLLKSSIFGLYEIHKALLIALYILINFELVIYLWSKVNFKFSFEWFVIRLASIETKQISQKLNVELIMRQVRWANFNFPEQKSLHSNNNFESDSSDHHLEPKIEIRKK